MKTVKMSDATASLADYTRRANGEPVVVIADGHPVAALVPIENADLETVSLSTDPQFIALVERARSQVEDSGGIGSEEMRRRLGVD